MKHSRWLTLLAAALVALTPGCGDKDHDSATVVVAPDPPPAPGPDPVPDPDPDPPPPPPPPVPDPDPEPEPEPEPEPVPPWVVQDTGTQLTFTAVSAISTTQAWAAAGSDVFRTTDGGETWTMVGQTPLISGFDMRPSIVHMQFHDALHGWASTWFSPYSTSDGGETWVAQYPTLVSSWNAMSSISASTAWMLSAKWGGITVTSDGGENWNGTAVGPGIGRAVKFINASTGWVALRSGGSETIYKTTDGGASWTSQFTIEGDYDGLTIRDITVNAADPNRIWVVGTSWDGDFIRASTDGGANWTTQQSDGSGGMRDVHFMNANNGWIAGVKIHRTTNGGVTWTALDTPQSGFMDLVFVTTTVGWAVGENGVILKTTTGGQ